MGLKSNFVLAGSPDVSLYIGEERTADAFVPHNELFGYYSLSDDGELAQGWRRSRALVEPEPRGERSEEREVPPPPSGWGARAREKEVLCQQKAAFNGGVDMEHRYEKVGGGGFL